MKISDIVGSLDLIQCGIMLFVLVNSIISDWIPGIVLTSLFLATKIPLIIYGKCREECQQILSARSLMITLLVVYFIIYSGLIICMSLEKSRLIIVVAISCLFYLLEVSAIIWIECRSKTPYQQIE